jgi:hypothetical protein
MDDTAKVIEQYGTGDLAVKFEAARAWTGRN